jgi:hypothetical protein
MADRTHDEEDALTGARTSRTKPSSPDRAQPTGAGVYQEGRVDSIGGGPTGTDRDDRTGEGRGRGVARREEGRSADEFMSSEVNDRTTAPMKDSKTRS